MGFDVDTHFTALPYRTESFNSHFSSVSALLADTGYLGATDFSVKL